MASVRYVCTLYVHSIEQTSDINNCTYSHEDSAESPPHSQLERRRRQRARHPIQRGGGFTLSGESSYQGNRVPIIEVNEVVPEINEHQQQLQQQWWLNQDQRRPRPPMQPRPHPMLPRPRPPMLPRPRPPIQHHVEQLNRDIPRRALQQLRLPLPYQRWEGGLGHRRANRQEQQRGMRQRELQQHRENQQQNNEQRQYGNGSDSDSDDFFDELIGPGPMFARH